MGPANRSPRRLGLRRLGPIFLHRRRRRPAAPLRTTPLKDRTIRTIVEQRADLAPETVLVDGRLRLAAETVELPGVGPEPFLRLAGGARRGLWARGDRWIAHAGALLEILAPPGADRFDAVRRRAAALLEDAELQGGADEGRIRFFGGFSFLEDHVPEGLWGAFPRGLFHLPALELEGDLHGVARLRARALLGPGETAGPVRDRLREHLDALVGRLAAGADRTASSGAVPAEAAPTDPSGWRSAVQDALAALDAGRVRKVVLARTLDVSTDGDVDPVEVASRLWHDDPASHAFLFEPAPGRVLVGAAPETVATLREGVFHATAVAGSTARGGDADEQRRLARDLLASAKDREEHRLTVEDMADRLRPVADAVHVEDEPHVLTLSRIQHLETHVRARVRPGTSVLSLLGALHPTPAVCGLPRDAALELLRAGEPFERGWYAGPVGFFEAGGGGIFVPALRSAVLGNGVWRLFAGAGIVEGSSPDAEWEETRMKFEPVLRALQASGVDLR